MMTVVAYLVSVSVANRDLHSFPTRRSSDLAASHQPRAFRERDVAPLVGDEELECDAIELAELPLERGHRCSFPRRDRKSTRLNSSHLVISYAVFCLKKKTLKTVTGDEKYQL